MAGTGYKLSARCTCSGQIVTSGPDMEQLRLARAEWAVDHAECTGEQVDVSGKAERARQVGFRGPATVT